MWKNLFLSVALFGALSCAAPAAWAQQNKADQQFLTKAIEGNLAEVEMGQLAQQKGNSDGVRSFGKTLEQDHAAANQKALAAAKEVGLTPPTEPSKKQKAEYDRMSKMSGEKFDREFVKHMVDDHKKDIKEFQQEAKKGNSASARFANDVLPDLQKHLDTAQGLQGNKTTTGSR